MKYFFKQILKTPMVLVFIAIVLFFGLYSFSIPAELDLYAIVTAIGLDRAEDEEDKIEISLLTFISTAELTFTEKYKVITSKGKSVSEALDFAGLHIGRQIGLAHVKLVVFGEKLLQEDVSVYMDYLSRIKHMSSNTKLVVVDSPVKEFLEVAQKLDTESSIKVSEVITSNTEYVYSADSTFKTFFKGMFGPTKVSLVPVLKLRGKEDGVAALADSESPGSGGGQGGKEKEVVNDGDSVLFKEGNEKARLSRDDVTNINLIRGDFSTGSIDVFGFSDEGFDNANLIFEILDKTIVYRVFFENGIPVLDIDMRLNVRLSEVHNKNGIIEKNVEFYRTSPKALNAIENAVKKYMADGIELMRDNQCDIIDFYTIIHNSNRRAFRNFLKSLDDEGDYLNKIVFKSGIEIFTK